MTRRRRRAGGGVQPIEAPAHDWTDAFTSGTTTHSYGARTSAGPHTILFLGFQDNATETVVSADWGGVAGEILVQVTANVDTTEQGVAIIYFPGAMSGTLTITFSNAVSDSHAVAASIVNLISSTPVDTDTHFVGAGNSTPCVLDGLTTPGEGGIRLAAWARYTTNTPTATWTNATEVVGVMDAGSFEFACAYSLEDSSSTISTSTSTANGRSICGASLR